MSPVKEIKNTKIELQSSQFRILHEEYKKLIIAKNYAANGRKSYHTQIKEFLYWLETYGMNSIKNVTSSLMIDYLEYLRFRPNKKKEGTLSDSMIDQHLFTIRLLIDYLLETNQIQSAVIVPKNNRGSHKERETLTQEEMALLFDHCITKKEKAVLSVAYGCGLRRTEMQDLNTNDLNFVSGVLVVREGKNHKRRDVPMSDGVIRDLKDYMIQERPLYLKEKNCLELSFFINNKGKRMKGEHMNGILQEIIQRTKDINILNKEITLHSLRHSVAEHLLDNGADLEFIRDFLGHTEIDTSHIYARKNKHKQNRLKK